MNRQRFQKNFDLDSDKVKRENYWLSFFHLSTKNPYHASLINNWLHLHSFARNLSAAGFIIASIIVALIAHDATLVDKGILVHLFFALLIGWLSLMRFWMIYTTYYSKGIIRSFYVNSKDSTNA